MATNSLIRKDDEEDEKSHKRKAADLALYYVIGLVPVMFSSYLGGAVILGAKYVLAFASLEQFRFTLLFCLCGLLLGVFVCLLFFVSGREFGAAKRPAQQPESEPQPEPETQPQPEAFDLET